MTYPELLKTVRVGLEMSQKDFAHRIGISHQYLCDLEKGRRLPSVAVTEKICAYLGRGPVGRKVWHIAGAAAHGWDIN